MKRKIPELEHLKLERGNDTISICNFYRCDPGLDCGECPLDTIEGHKEWRESLEKEE